ncbi:MAG: response regulator transcription factor [Bacteroidia bacterium]
MKILIVEDEPKVAAFIKRGLTENDFETEVAFDGYIGKQIFNSGNFNLVILDINLPQLNGIELCKAIRSVNANVPILMLTAMGTTEDKIAGFDSGADDYLLKPFEFAELLARIKALLKRTQQRPVENHILKVADLEIDIDSKEVKRGASKIMLTAKEFMLLEFLVRNKGKVVSRVDIAEKVWDLNFDTGTNVIDVYVNFLRNKIDKGFAKKLIHTHIGMGYIIKND